MINVQYPFSDLTEALIKLLQNLKPTDWDKITLFNNRKVRTIANELLKTHLNIITEVTKTVTLPISGIDTVDVETLDANCKNLENAFYKNVGVVAVDEMRYSYCWLLQQYIRQALNNQHLLQKVFYLPFLNTVMGDLVSHYQHMEASEGTLIKTEIVGDAGGVWTIEKSKAIWKSANVDKPADVTIYLDQQIAWLLFSNTLHVNEIGQFYQIIGNKQLGSHFLNMRASVICRV